MFRKGVGVGGLWNCAGAGLIVGATSARKSLWSFFLVDSSPVKKTEDVFFPRYWVGWYPLPPTGLDFWRMGVSSCMHQNLFRQCQQKILLDYRNTTGGNRGLMNKIKETDRMEVGRV